MINLAAKKCVCKGFETYVSKYCSCTHAKEGIQFAPTGLFGIISGFIQIGCRLALPESKVSVKYVVCRIRSWSFMSLAFLLSLSLFYLCFEFPALVRQIDFFE